jgi:hypothetical protein
LDDYEAICNLAFTYPERLDVGDHEGLGALFEHGEVRCFAGGIAAGEPAVGAGGVKEMYDRLVQLHDGQPLTRHVITNLIVEIDEAGGTAKGRSYFQVVQQAPGLPLQIIASGRYHDSFEKKDGGWRFVQKIIRADYLGDLSRHARPQG